MRELFLARFLVLADHAFHTLRLLQGSPLPKGLCSHRQQTSFAEQIHTERGLLLQHCLKKPKAVAWSTGWLTKVVAGKAFAGEQLRRDFVTFLTRSRDNSSRSLSLACRHIGFSCACDDG